MGKPFLKILPFKTFLETLGDSHKVYKEFREWDFPSGGIRAGVWRAN